MRKVRIILFLVFQSVSGFAGTISGGEIIYDFVERPTATSTKYRITLRLFINMTTPNAEIPAVAALAIFDNFNYFRVRPAPFTAERINVSPMPGKDPTKCVTNAPGAMNFQLAEYAVEVILPDNYNGYTIAYQGVNRETTFENIKVIQYGPPDFSNNGGSTFTGYIPGTILAPPLSVQYNSSARFNTNIETICKSSSLYYDFSATDPDGDELFYFFDNSYHGATAQDLFASNPTKPPYESVIYSGSYKGTEPMGKYVKIDNRTGIMTGIAPPFPGNYVVSVLIYEFRAGTFISFHRKDMTIVVSNCNVVEASLQKTYINCKDSTFYFSNLVFPPGIDTYDWEFGDGNHSTDANPVHTYSAAGIYTLKLFVNKGQPCMDSAVAEVRVFPGFNPDFDVQGTCRNYPIQFVDKSTAAHGVINKWEWNFGNGLTSVFQNPVSSYAVSKEYTVMLAVTSSVGCWATATKVIKIDDKPNFRMSPKDTLICNVDTLRIAAVGMGTASWSPNYNISDVNSLNPLVSPDVSTTYKVLLSDPYGCVGIDSIKVNVVDRVTQAGDYDTTICQTDQVRLKLTSDALYFNWTPNDGSLNDPNVKNPLASPAVNTTYRVVGKISDKCFAENTVIVRPVPYPKAIVDGVEICLGQSAQLHASGGSIYNWSPALFLSDANIADPLVINPTVGVKYKLTVRDILGCPKPVQKEVLLKVIQVKADAGPRDTAVVFGQPLQLNATGGTDYVWLPDNSWLSNIHVSDPLAFPKDNIEYIVKVSDALGCYAYDSINVKLYKLVPGIYMPNAFTPNNDGKNDQFKPAALGLRSVDLFRIYNRFGQLIYNNNDPGKGWDGTFRGQKLESGTYIWVAEGTDFSNKKIQSRGTVVLVRH